MSGVLVTKHDNMSGLPALVEKAAFALANAKTAAEVLDARDMASVAYDAAKKAARLAAAKNAHDDLVMAAHRAQADALIIEAQAKRRLADEYDAAQAKKQVAQHGGARSNVGNKNVALPTASDVGFRDRVEVMEAREIRASRSRRQ